jgi:hypothetical protein
MDVPRNALQGAAQHGKCPASTGGVAALPQPGGENTHVLFWHLVDGRIHDFGGRFTAIPDPVRWWQDAIRQVFRGSREQYFVRVTSNVPFADIWDDSGFQRVMRGLADLGLAEPPDR